MYTLALFGAPELSVMNRLRETAALSSVALGRLAAAYVLSGQLEVGRFLMDRKPSSRTGASVGFGPVFRDQAMTLEAEAIRGRLDRTTALLGTVASALDGAAWLHTHEMAFALDALSRAVGNGNGKKHRWTTRPDGSLHLS